jgi:CDGSH-type Zn-finger protein
MSEAKIGGTSPIAVEVQANQAYWWCTCGHSKNQPFCDGSHQGTPFLPLEWTADADKRVFFCTCKQTAKSPLCDGAHKAL